MSENHKDINKKFSKLINVNDQIKEFCANPTVKSLPKKERKWLLQHCEFTMDSQNLEDVQNAERLFKDKGYPCILWNKDKIHPIERHFKASLLSVYARIKDLEKIVKIASDANLLLFSVYHYKQMHTHPLVSGLYPVDVLDICIPETRVLLGGYRLFDYRLFLQKLPEACDDKANKLLSIFYLFDEESQMKSGEELLKNSEFMTISTYAKPELEFDNFTGSLLQVDLQLKNVETTASLLEDLNPKGRFVGIYKDDGMHLTMHMLQKYALLKAA